MKRTFVAVALTAAVAVAPVSGATGAAALPSALPDTFVAEWDATGSRAFTAAALTPAEGHVIFAYVAVAV